MGFDHGYDTDILINPERVEHFITGNKLVQFYCLTPLGLLTILYSITTGCNRGYGWSTLSGLRIDYFSFDSFFIRINHPLQSIA
jgi:hypothetical protein